MRHSSRIRTTPRLLSELRSLRVVVYYPDDENGRLVLEQLTRIGCRTEQRWPPPQALPEGADLVVLGARPELLTLSIPWLEDVARPPIIAITNYESPTILELLLRVDVEGALSTPVRSFGLLSAMALACHRRRSDAEYRRRIDQLELRLAGVRTLHDAKTLLMQVHGMTEDEAYQQIRRRAMEKRMSVQQMADEIIRAHELLRR